MTNATPNDERPSMDKPLTNYPSSDISVLKRSSNKRKASQSWDRKFSTFTDDELANKRTELGKQLSDATKEHKRYVSMDSQYWDRYIEVARLRQEQAQLESQLGLRKSSSSDDMSCWKQGAWMNEIFGAGAREELFAPENGLFLHVTIEKALEKGKIAIVPDIDMEPANPMMPNEDLRERQDRMKHWEQQEIKDYKVIVILKNHKDVTKSVFNPEHYGIENLASLDGRKLVFLTDFRPRAPWNNDVNYQHEEVRKCTRYWGTRSRYVKRNQLLGFVEEMGHDVESILDDGGESEHEYDDHEQGSDEPGLELVEALVQGAITSSMKCGEAKEEEEETNND
ncbi:hypothetical protein FACUT_11561 [Fusarium acutatum]|uniref:Uncharacterized protein n=1 Tax=Fusarium acutatum TaxID=78861 RepID=A0A8H4JDX9_9HYPO|nr:hypothetical protein FACUT_11561 [Fusarium acutatum]